ncbi:hypothetical protein GCM10022223_27920 [Kineosporia mesophila]|uniref:Isocitrate lyase/phosphoenolpyruvate mutase family protein n=1 Tax=Kineosporia mesophila TaxID=566012 RepID=A0ABP6ZJY9_9ACTN|nr:isocitrate lyase/phosphoenolpyruvate mutase family protein [Kineosporia mesophila]MCD5353475.1 isocitrate lyase/phosphoenolpyruvate mutase family protein [Kineosporia mesophila]
MTSQNTARNFADLHRTPDPVILPNAWDAGSAVLIAAAGATRELISTGTLTSLRGYAGFGEVIGRFR